MGFWGAEEMEDEGFGERKRWGECLCHRGDDHEGICI